jgi:hypothetical protein
LHLLIKQDQLTFNDILKRTERAPYTIS